MEREKQPKSRLRFPFPAYRLETGNGVETKMETPFPIGGFESEKWKRDRNGLRPSRGNAEREKRRLVSTRTHPPALPK